MKKSVLTFFLLIFMSFITVGQTKDAKSKESFNEKNSLKPLIFVDGKKFDFPVESIDPTIIATMHVVKGENAIKKYNAPNGVILIVTKLGKTFNYYHLKTVENGNMKNDKVFPTIIIDGKESNKKELQKLTPDKIEKMEVLKGKEALEKHNALNGVIIITTKKVN